MEAKLQAKEEEELANNPMKLLEKRTNQSKNEMETAEAIDDLKEINKRQATFGTDDFLLRNLWKEQEAEKEAQEKADEDFIKEVMQAKSQGIPIFEIAEKFDPDGQGSSNSAPPNDKSQPTTRRSNPPPAQMSLPRVSALRYLIVVGVN